MEFLTNSIEYWELFIQLQCRRCDATLAVFAFVHRQFRSSWGDYIFAVDLRVRRNMEVWYHRFYQEEEKYDVQKYKTFIKAFFNEKTTHIHFVQYNVMRMECWSAAYFKSLVRGIRNKMFTVRSKRQKR